MIIEIISPELAESEALEKALARIAYHRNVERATVFVNPRVPLDAPEWKQPGWLEYLIKFKYSEGGSMTVAMIQRKPGGRYEFHS